MNALAEEGNQKKSAFYQPSTSQPLPESICSRMSFKHFSQHQKPQSFHIFRWESPPSRIIGSVTHVNNIDKFYVTSEKFRPDLLEHSLKRKYNSRPSIELVTANLGKAHAVEVDGRWYRAELLSLTPGHTVEVFLVDIGKRVFVPKKSVHLLDKEDVVLPKQAICCSLRGVWKKSWTQDDKNLLLEVGTIEALFVSKFHDEMFSTIICKGLWSM
jgi:hypothetical protein